MRGPVERGRRPAGSAGVSRLAAVVCARLSVGVLGQTTPGGDCPVHCSTAAASLPLPSPDTRIVISKCPWGQSQP